LKFLPVIITTTTAAFV